MIFLYLFTFFYTSFAMEPIVLVHGGAGNIPVSRVPGKINGVQLAVKEGYKVFENGGNSLDAVEAAVRSMEKDENFNAGYGSVLNLDGKVEMEASIMCGRNLDAGAVTLVTDVLHPISLARMVMEKTPHVFLGGCGVKEFIKKYNVPTVDPESLITEFAKKALSNYKGAGLTEIGHTQDETSKIGDTVGAVAIDKDGNIAVATSTGGMSGKMVGRIGDTPQIGSGTYADNLIGGVSTTGHGETILKYNVAQKIISAMERGIKAQEATESIIKAMTARLNKTAGAITISNKGDVGVYFSSERMSWAYLKNGEIHFGIEQEQHEIEQI